MDHKTDNPTSAKHTDQEAPDTDLRILKLLSQTFPNVKAASTEIINLEAILNLPKGTEHFVADLHGEHEAFSHLLRNASGNIRRKVTEIFGTSLREQDISNLCTLIYYPESKLEYIKAEENDIDDFYGITLHQLILVLQSVTSKYTRSRVRKQLPGEYAYIIEELLHESPSDDDKEAYFRRIIETIISTGQADSFIIALCNVIQRLSIDQLHILGDIFDRGPGAHLILDTLCDYERFDIQWGNHDVLWIGACAGNDACIANALRMSLRYGNMATLEDGYGINLVPLATFALETYGDDPCMGFMPHIMDIEHSPSEKTLQLMAKMHKAISIIQFKLEGQIIDRRPEWKMGDRKLLHMLRPERGVIEIDGKEYELKDSNFPTVNAESPYEFSPEESSLVKKLHHSFMVSDKFNRHIKCLLSHGCMYAIYNSNLLYHGSMPLNPDGTLKEVELHGVRYKGRELMHRIGMMIRSAFNDDTERELKEFAIDYCWYLWCGQDSPLFDKSKMATFERYFIKDESTHVEEKGNYFKLRNEENVIDGILDAFGVLGEHRHIINGHVPVRAVKGESPIRANGKLLVIDGGFAKAYHATTGIAGYTLVYHSRGLQLVQHEPFESAEKAVKEGTDILGTKQIVELSTKRLRIRDTDKGEELKRQIEELRDLLYAFRHGIIKERHSLR